MFPLPGVFLFPLQILPLHIFEPRYRRMIEDSLDGPGRIVLATVPEEQAEHLEGSPKVLPIAGLGEIARHQRLPDGRFLVWLAGLGRVRIEEIASELPYRRVRYEMLEEIPASPAEATRLREPLVQAILARRKDILNFPDEVPTGLLADVLLQHVAMPPDVMERLFAECDNTRRAELALAAHARFPPPPPGQAEEKSKQQE